MVHSTAESDTRAGRRLAGRLRTRHLRTETAVGGTVGREAARDISEAGPQAVGFWRPARLLGDGVACGREIWEKAMAPHSSTHAWKIPWMEEPGRLQSMGSLRVGHH